MTASERNRHVLAKNLTYAESISTFADAVLTGRNDVAPYSLTYLGVHELALKNIYLCVKEVLGESVFGALATVYARHFPASQWDVNRYGERFGELLAAQVHGAKAEAFNWPAIAALAAIEYAITEQYYADKDLRFGGKPSVVEADSTIKLQKEWIQRLAELHPYADVAARISFESPVVVWRDGLRTKVMPAQTILAGGAEP